MTAQGWRRLEVVTMVGAMVLALAACASMSSVQQMRGEPAADLSAVKIGASRGDVEASVGAPVRTWVTQEGVEYRLYRYDGGVPPDPAAAFLIPIDVLTLGLPTLLNRVIAATPEERERRMRTLAVSYDRDGVVLGVFVDVGDFAALPADGKPPPRP